VFSGGCPPHLMRMPSSGRIYGQRHDYDVLANRDPVDEDREQVDLRKVRAEDLGQAGLGGPPDRREIEEREVPFSSTGPVGASPARYRRVNRPASMRTSGTSSSTSRAAKTSYEDRATSLPSLERIRGLSMPTSAPPGRHDLGFVAAPVTRAFRSVLATRAPDLVTSAAKISPRT
jgi:hypothetical protein